MHVYNTLVLRHLFVDYTATTTHLFLFLLLFYFFCVFVFFGASPLLG